MQKKSNPLSNKDKDLYTILGINRIANKADIKKAYREKAKQLHPDKGGDPQEFKNVVKAYMILYDDISRAKYDKSGDEEIPFERKPVEIEKLAKTFVIKTFFNLIDSFGENADKHNLKDEALKLFVDLEKELRTRLRNNRNTWKALKRKLKAVKNKLVDIKTDGNNMLEEILLDKTKHIEVQEILPVKEDHRKLLIDLATYKRAKELIQKECYDGFIKQKESMKDIMAQWDQSMRYDLYQPVDNIKSLNEPF